MQTRHDTENLRGGLHQIPPLRAQGIQQKRRRKDCQSQRGWRTSEEQGPLNQLGKAHMHLQRLRHEAQGYMGPNQVLCVSIIAIGLVFLWFSDSCLLFFFSPVGLPCLTSICKFLLHLIIFSFVMFGVIS